MQENYIINQETIELIESFSCDLSSLEKTFDLLTHCTNNQVYEKTFVEICSFMKILKFFILKLKTDFD